jgi:hypothetical protein
MKDARDLLITGVTRNALAAQQLPLRRKNTGRIVEDYAFLYIYTPRRNALNTHVRKSAGQRPHVVQLEDVPDPDGMNRRAGILTPLVTAHRGLAVVIQALVTPRPAEPEDNNRRQADPGS